MKEYIENRLAIGKPYFTADEIINELGFSKTYLNNQIYRFKKKKLIDTPAKGLYIIITPQYKFIESLPADQLVPILMKYWNLDYYACLLTAAMYNGSSHQKPQIFQVMTTKQHKMIACGAIRIEFMYKKSLKNIKTLETNVATGTLIYSTPEYTAYDLFMYSHQCGGLNHIATVLSELIESMNLDELEKLLDNSKENSWKQRFGYILDNIETFEPEKQRQIINLLEQHIIKINPSYTPIEPAVTIYRKKRNKKWKIIENATVESDND